MFNINDRYIEKISMLGAIKEISDEVFYLIFQPRNGLGAKLENCGNGIGLSVMEIESYEPLSMRTRADGQYYNLTEREAMDILTGLFGN